MSTIKMDGLKLPGDAVTQTFAFLARRGAGKTYGASVLAEGMLEAGNQIVVLDPVGVWYGLRLSADGKGKGFDIPIFGGLHGDIPLEPGAGALIADLLVDRGISAILDVSMFRKNDRKKFATDFAEQLFHRKKSFRSPLHVFVEEAQVFVPQRVSADEARMLGAFEDLVKLGRNFGIGITLISQRPQAVNKDALNQTEALFVMQTNGSQERKALEAWIVEQGVASKGIVDELPSLPIGTAYLWSPSWLRKLEKIKIGTRKTYNASATPTAGVQRMEPKSLSPVDLDMIESAMEATVQKAKADSPTELRRQIAELKKQLETRPVETKQVEVPILRMQEIDALASAVGDAEKCLGVLERKLEPVFRALMAVQVALKAAEIIAANPAKPSYLPTTTTGRSASGIIMDDPVPSSHEKRVIAAEVMGTGDQGLSKAERSILTALAQSPGGCEKNQLGILSGYSPTSGGFNGTLGSLRTKGFVDRGIPVRITDAGLKALGEYEKLPRGKALLEYWVNRLNKCEGTILRVLVEGDVIWSKSELAKITEYSPNSGGFNGALGRLRALKLIQPGRELAASEVFSL